MYGNWKMNFMSLHCNNSISSINYITKSKFKAKISLKNFSTRKFDRNHKTHRKCHWYLHFISKSKFKSECACNHMENDVAIVCQILEFDNYYLSMVLITKWNWLITNIRFDLIIFIFIFYLLKHDTSIKCEESI